jgi:hypothetical protein
MGVPVTRKLKLIITGCSNKKTLLAARGGFCWIWGMKCAGEGNLVRVFLLVKRMLCDTELLQSVLPPY